MLTTTRTRNKHTISIIANSVDHVLNRVRSPSCKNDMFSPHSMHRLEIRVEKARKSIPQLDVATLKADVKKLVADTSASARFSAFTRNAKKDLYIQEAVAILKDEL